MIELRGMNMPLTNTRVVAYWDFYDFATGRIMERGRPVKNRAMPHFGEVVVGVPGKPNAIVRDIKFSGIKDKLPCYNVFV
ncbi:MAG: hypothetical protein NTZ34_11275 [Chloroflexi bacterium]|nr:hypothetical protein [Chloroflexota bacterium]